MIDDDGQPRGAPHDSDRDGARPLHVVDASAGASAMVCAALAARRERAAMVIVGTAADERLARSIGADVIASHAPPLGEPLLALRAWRSVLRAALAATGRPSVGDVTCTSLSSAVATRWAIPSARIAYVSLRGPESSVAAALARRRAAWRPHEVIALSEGAARRCAELFGHEPRRRAAEIDPAILRTDRAAIRRRWSARPDEYVVGLLGEPSASADARRAAEVVGIAAVRGAPVRLVLDPDAARCGQTSRWIDELGLPHLIAADTAVRRPWEIVAGLDAVLLLDDSASVAGGAVRGAGRPGGLWFGSLRPWPVSPLAALWAEAANRPVVAAAGALDAELVERLHDPTGTRAAFSTFAPDDPLTGTRTLLAWCRAAESVVSVS
ncbi:MAG: hypothetical protein U0572_15510 [Phycisphaerales bacterium]